MEGTCGANNLQRLQRISSMKPEQHRLAKGTILALQSAGSWFLAARSFHQSLPDKHARSTRNIQRYRLTHAVSIEPSQFTDPAMAGREAKSGIKFKARRCAPALVISEHGHKSQSWTKMKATLSPCSGNLENQTMPPSPPPYIGQNFCDSTVLFVMVARI